MLISFLPQVMGPNQGQPLPQTPDNGASTRGWGVTRRTKDECKEEVKTESDPYAASMQQSAPSRQSLASPNRHLSSFRPTKVKDERHQPPSSRNSSLRGMRVTTQAPRRKNIGSPYLLEPSDGSSKTPNWAPVTEGDQRASDFQNDYRDLDERVASGSEDLQQVKDSSAQTQGRVEDRLTRVSHPSSVCQQTKVAFAIRILHVLLCFRHQCQGFSACYVECGALQESEV